MTAKNKAIELVESMAFSCRECDYEAKAKQCALIAVNEIIQSEPLEPNDTPDWLQPEDWFSEANISAEKYWKEVKQEIEKL